jgi:hypothetical protein
MSVLRLEPPWYHKYQGDLRSAEGGVMLGKYKIALAMIGSFAFGAVAAQSLNAQARPPAYVVAEVDVKNREKFETQFLPPAVKAVWRRLRREQEPVSPFVFTSERGVPSRNGTSSKCSRKSSRNGPN